MSYDREIAFPTLTPEQIESLRPFGSERDVHAGDVLIAEFDRNYPFFVVLDGTIEILDHTGVEERLIHEHTPRQFSGDVDMLTGRGALFMARASSDSRVLELDTTAFRRAVESLPEVGETILKSFLVRRSLLLEGGFQGIKIVGSRFSPEAHRLRDFATRNQIPFTWVDVESDEKAEEMLRAFGITTAETPVVIGNNCGLMRRPTVDELARCFGLEADIVPETIYDLAVVGAGPAGLAASVYAASEGLKTITFDATAAGGQAGTSSRIENYLGFPTGISGGDLTRNALIQAQRFGATVSVPDQVVGLRLEGGHRVLALSSGVEVQARCVLVASGVEYRRLEVPGYIDFEGAGIYYAATEMEARLCRGESIIIVGGGNSAGQAAVYLSRFAREVHIVIRSDDLNKSMSRYLVERVDCIPNVKVHRVCEIAEATGDTHLRSVRLRYADRPDLDIPTSALFMFIGAAPYTSWLRGCVHLDAKGFVVTGDNIPRDVVATDTWTVTKRAPWPLETSLPGVFAAGDARSGSVKRVASAVGEGSMVVSLVHAHIGTAV
ncbi:MAG TPA: FAD-dependent oxidoreductase [Gemmatimonadaceae bacterium]